MLGETLLGTPRRWQMRRLSRRVRHRLHLAWRRPLAAWRSLPHFIIIGAQKCGTSSLYAYLTAHPQVIGASWKEVFFFDNQFDKGLPWYRAHFPLARRLERRSAVTGEASPYYLRHPCAAERIASVLPEIRLIALLRNPVDRAISHYWHQVKRDREPLTLEDALAAEDERVGDAEAALRADCSRRRENHQRFAYVRGGLYAKQLKRYGEHFDSEQLLVLKSENLFRHTQFTFNRVTDFLGLAPWSLEQDKPRNTASYPETSAATRERLARFFRPHNRVLYDYLNVDAPWW